MSRQKKSGGDVEITLDRRFLLSFLIVLALGLALGVGVLAGQFRGRGFSSTAAQQSPQTQFQQSAAPAPGQQVPPAQEQGQIQAVPQPVSPGQGEELTEADAVGMVAGDVMQSPCFVINLLEFQKNVVAADFRLTKDVGTSGPHPQLAVEGLNSHCGNAYDFGQLEPTAIGQQTFSLKNVGDAQLTVTGLYTSCGCTVAQVEGYEVGGTGVLSPTLVLQPGEAKEFMIALDAKRVEGSAEPRIVQVFSDDPRGVPFGEQWPFPGQDKELRFAILAQVGAPDSGGN
ncbi:MAG: DUF1573 domain-containing protein [Anaerolineae bacterium]